MKSKRRFIPLVFLGAIIMSLLVIVPAFTDTGAVRFYDMEDTDEDQEWARQGGMVYVEVEDSDLDVNADLSGASAEMHTLDNERTFYLMNKPVADANGDGFVNAQDVSVVSAANTAMVIRVDRAAEDGRVDLLEPYTGDVLVSYEGAVANETMAQVKSQADPTGIEVMLTETSADSGVFRGMLTTTSGDSNDASDMLKVGKNDVITATYSDEDPSRNTSKTIQVETTAPVISNLFPAHNSSDRSDPDIEFNVTDGDSGISDEDNIWVIFAVDEDENGSVDREYKYQVSEAPRGDVDEEDDVFSVKQGLPSEVDVDNNATIYWWALAEDLAGNLKVTDRQATVEVNGDDVTDLCSSANFPDGSLVGLNVKDVASRAEIAGCQPYAVRIDNQEPSLESATTGPTWNSDDDEVNMGANDNNSVLVVFSESLDADTVDNSDFTVEGTSVTDVQVEGKNVFLTVSSEISSDEEPDVELVGSVRDVAGNRQTSGEDTAEDGIAPTLTVSVEGGNRSVTDGSIKITIMADEDVGTPKVTISQVVDASASDNSDTEDVDEAMYALSDGDVKDGVLKSQRSYEVSYSASDPGLYNVYVTANDANSSNTGKAGVSKGPIDLSDDTSAILFEFDDAVGKPMVTPEKTDNSSPFISIDFSAEGTEYEDNDGMDLDSHGDVMITSATLESPGMDAMDITDMLVSTDQKVFLYKASDLAKGDHVIKVTATDDAGNELEDEKLTVEVSEREPFELMLKPGWNLVSLPGTPTNTSINAVIPADHPASTILSYDAADGWMTAIRSEDGTWLGTLTSVDATRAYWIQTDSFESINVDIPRISAGTSVPPTIALSAGWNFVPVIDVSGELSHGDQVSSSEYFNGVDVNRVYTFDTLMGMWDVVEVGNENLMVGYGYWVHADDDDVLAP